MTFLKSVTVVDKLMLSVPSEYIFINLLLSIYMST